MKNIMRITFALVLALTLCCGALAEGAVRYEGGAEEFVFLPGSVHSASDLFGEQFKDVLPGDVLTQTITVNNASGKNVRLYLRAEPVADADKDFLDQLRLTVSADSKEIFDAQAGQQGALYQNTLLGTFKKNGSTALTVTLTVPETLGNDYMDRSGIVPWTFLAEEIIEDDTPETGDWFQLPLWIGAAVILMAGIVLLYVRRRKTEEN